LNSPQARRHSYLPSGNILVFSITDLLGNISRGMVFPYSSLFILALGGDAAQIGLINFMGLVAGLIVLPIAGYIADHADRVRLLVFSGFVSSLFLVMIIFAPTWQVIAAASLLFGLIVITFPAYASLVADSLSSLNRGRDLGMMNTISAAPAIFSPYIAGFIIERYTANLGMRILYGIMLLTYLAGAMIQHRFLTEPAHTQRDPLKFSALLRSLTQAYRAFPSLLKQMSTPLKALAGVILLSFLANGAASPFWVVYATEQLGFSATQWGLILLVESIVRLAVFLPAGMLGDRWGRKKTLLTALCISLITTPLFIILKSFTAILVIRGVTAVAFSLAIPVSTALMADLVPRQLRGQMMAAIGQGGLMIAPTGGGAGGPALGYLFIPPVLLASLAGGYLYMLNPIFPWLFSVLTIVLSIGLTAYYIRDAVQIEI
jgi:DHA1 family multidrug resistance protein-like MFS transporter